MKQNPSQSGSIFYFILIAIVLIGGLTVALRDNGGLEGNVDKEAVKMQAQAMIKQGNQLARAVQTILSNGASESDIRAAHPNANAAYGTITTTPQYQIYSSQGGNAPYMVIPMSYKIYDTAWEIGGDRAFPGVGSAKAELYTNAYFLTDQLCLAINKQLGYTNTTIPTSTCNNDANARFTGTFSTSPAVIDNSAFSPQPAIQFCVNCGGAAGNAYFIPLIAR